MSSSALHKGALEALITPSSGRVISRTRKMAEETDKAQMSNTASTVVFRGANSPKLKKRTTSQKIRRIRNIAGSEFCCCSIAEKAGLCDVVRKLVGLREKLFL